MITLEEIKQLFENYVPAAHGLISSNLVLELYENFKKDEQFINQNIVVASNFHDNKQDALNYIWLEYLNVQKYKILDELRKPINLNPV
jgi:hypothetical protein